MDLFSKIDKAYPIPSQIAIMNGNDPSDIRYVCDSVSDFQDVYDNYSYEMRYEGLVTYEKNTGKLKVCKGDTGSGFTWSEVGSGASGGGSNPELYSATIATTEWTDLGSSQYSVTIAQSVHGFSIVPEQLVSISSTTGTDLDREVSVDSDINVTITIETTDNNAPDEEVIVKIYGWV